MKKPTYEIDAYLDGEPTPDQARALQAWIQADKSNAKTFLAAIRLHQQIGSQLRKDRFDQALHGSARPATTKDGDAAIQALAELARLHEEGLKQPLELELHNKKRDQHAHAGQAQPLRLKAKLIITGSLAAAIALAGLTVLIVNLFTGPEQPLANQFDDAIVVATLTDTQDAQWGATAAERALARGSSLHAGDKLTLTAGFAEITTNHGAIALIEAPATIELLDHNNAIRLHAGKLVGICETDSSKGFLVRTPHMDITDLGTRFGVLVDEPGNTLAEVFEGRISAKPIHTAEPIELSNQESLAIDSSGREISTERFDSDLFVAMMSAREGIASMSDSVTYLPNSLDISQRDHWPDDKRVYVFEEMPPYRLGAAAPLTAHKPGKYQRFDLPKPSAAVPAGTTIRSYIMLINASENVAHVGLKGSIRFNGQVLGIIANPRDHEGFVQAAQPSGAALLLPGPGHRLGSGWLETGDQVVLGKDGQSLSVSLHVNGGFDIIRVIVREPTREPTNGQSPTRTNQPTKED